MNRPRREPTAFKLDDPGVEAVEDSTIDQLEPPPDDAHQAVEAIIHPPRRGIRWAALAVWSGGALVSLALGLAIDGLIRDLFARNDWLGWAGFGLAVAGAAVGEVVCHGELPVPVNTQSLSDLRPCRPRNTEVE